MQFLRYRQKRIIIDQHLDFEIVGVIVMDVARLMIHSAHRWKDYILIGHDSERGATAWHAEDQPIRKVKIYWMRRKR